MPTIVSADARRFGFRGGSSSVCPISPVWELLTSSHCARITPATSPTVYSRGMASVWQAARVAATTTTIFAEMSALAVATESVNLGQGFPDTDGPDFML